MNKNNELEITLGKKIENMKIIISHDVDHLYVQDHFFKDLIIPKLWVRSFIHLLQGKISVRTFCYRLIYIFSKKQNYIDEVSEYDKAEGIPSVFFFGMKNGLGMSYNRKKSLKYQKMLKEKKFDIGVHGIDYTDINKMQQEHDLFSEMSGMLSFGIRNHYVRFDEETFSKMERCGYLYDSTWFDKTKVNIRAPYKIGKMWEFPLHIMDGYILPVGHLEKGKENTIAVLDEAEKMGMPYCTILFHDYLFNPKCYPEEREWYLWLVTYLKERGYEFISYRDAIQELERTNK